MIVTIRDGQGRNRTVSVEVSLYASPTFHWLSCARVTLFTNALLYSRSYDVFSVCCGAFIFAGVLLS